MKIKSIKRLPLKIALFFPPSRELLMNFFVSGSHNFRDKLWNLISNKPPIFFRYNNLYKIKTGGDSGYLVSLNKNSYEGDWHRIFSIGHDIEIKRYYYWRIINNRPSQFIDIGANFGMHSLIFLSHGIKTTYIEPNSECVGEFSMLCKLNNYKPEILNLGLDRESGSLMLIWPKNKTWLGEVMINNPELKIPEGYQKEEVIVSTLNKINAIEKHNALIKIDAEGHELSILEGGREAISKLCPEIIFETIPDDPNRSKLYAFFCGVEYRIIDMFSKKILNKNDFCSSSNKNFLGQPINY